MPIDNAEATVAHSRFAVDPKLVRPLFWPSAQKPSVGRDSIVIRSSKCRPLIPTLGTTLFNTGKILLIIQTERKHFDETSPTVREFQMNFPVLYLDQICLDRFPARRLFPAGGRLGRSRRGWRHGRFDERLGRRAAELALPAAMLAS